MFGYLAVVLSIVFVGEGQTSSSLAQMIEAKDASQIERALKANPALAKARNQNGIGMLSLAAQTDCAACVKVLLDAGADVRAADEDAIGRTPLHWAAGWSTSEVVRLLVERGAPLNVKTKKGDTPLSFAEDNFYKDSTAEREKIVRYLKNVRKK